MFVAKVKLQSGFPTRPARLGVTVDDLRTLRALLEKRAPIDAELHYEILEALVAARLETTLNRMASLEAKNAANLVPATDMTTAIDLGLDASTPDGEVVIIDVGAGGNGQSGSESDNVGRAKKPKPSAKGHGRSGAKAFPAAASILYPLFNFIAGMQCVKCITGKLYKFRPRVILEVRGSLPFSGVRHVFEQAKCSLCGALLTAPLPEGLKQTICGHDHKSAVLLAYLHYFGGMPFERLATMQRAFEAPVARSTQWDIVSQLDDRLGPLSRALEHYFKHYVINLRYDDTGIHIASLEKAIKAEIQTLLDQGKTKEAKAVRTGINVTGLYGETPEGVVVLYFSGRHHAGEVLEQLFKGVDRSQSPVITVSDGASKNYDHPTVIDMIKGGCNVHGLRKFKDLADIEPVHAAAVKKIYQAIYQNDAYAKNHRMSPDERLAYHREHSLPELAALKKLIDGIIESRNYEPNGPLWQALSFYVNQWDRLTLFTRVAGVPLDTNLAEQCLKLPIRYRKASQRYRNETGAEVGDRMMGLFKTVMAQGINPIEYFMWALERPGELRENPAAFLPWEYRKIMNAGPKPRSG